MRKITPQTFDLTKMLTHLRQAKYYIQSLLKEKSVSFGIKDELKRIENRITVSERQLFDGLPTASKMLLEKELLHIENTVQLEAINNLILDLPAEARDVIETFVAELHTKYNSTEAA